MNRIFQNIFSSGFFNGLSYYAFFLGLISILGVIAFHFPEYLSTPRLRDVYEEEDLRFLLRSIYSFAIFIGLAGVFFSNVRGIAASGLILAIAAYFLGGHQVPVPETIHQKPYYLSLDLILLDIFFMSLVFFPIERLLGRKKIRFLREGLQTDLCHYTFNHLLMGGLFYLISFPGLWLKGLFTSQPSTPWVSQLPIWVQVVMILFIADFTQYWVHRACHKFSFLWAIHKIHHSCEVMDWLASSRLHVLDVLIVRSLSYTPIVLLGFSNDAIQSYLPVVAFQGLFVHSNFKYELSYIKYIFTTPQVHHWHHSDDERVMNKNFAVSFSFIDRIMGTYYCPKGEWPKSYGLIGETISSNFFRQLLYPFQFFTKKN